VSLQDSLAERTNYLYFPARQGRKIRYRQFCVSSPEPAMRRFALLVCLLILPACTGCSLFGDFLFGLLGDSAYSGGGVTSADKRDHFDRQVQASQDYGSVDR
jgi:hypothetical protein